MSPEARSIPENLRDEDRMRRRLLRLLAARLALAFVVLLIALTLVGAGREGSEAAERGLYGTVAVAFLATALYALVFGWIRRAARLGAVQLAADVAIVTSLVYFSGGKDSIFTFLYVPIIVYGALLFERAGAYGSASLASLAYGALLVSLERGWLTGVEGGVAGPGIASVALWGIHSSAWLLVALLASALSRELQSAGRELHRSASDLRRLQRLHERTVESLTSGLLTTDREARISSFNPQAEQITGVAVRDAIGRDMDEIIPGIRDAISDPAGASDRRLRSRIPFRNARGEQCHLGVAGSILREGDGESGGHVVIFQDVTQVVEMEQELRRSERLAAVGELAAGMAHEVRNPLAAISGSIQMLRGSVGPADHDAEPRRLMEIVVRETDRLDALIAEFLRFARPAPAKRTVVVLDTLVGEMLEVFRGSCPKGIQVECAIATDVAILADRDQVRQLLWNLLLNAVQAMPSGGRLEVGAAAVPLEAQEGLSPDRNGPEGGEGPWVEITVVDSGTGISPDVIERIFEPFFTTRPDGSGLGLATVHRIAEANGGGLRVESKPGEGTRFRVVLPGAGATS